MSIRWTGLVTATLSARTPREWFGSPRPIHRMCWRLNRSDCFLPRKSSSSSDSMAPVAVPDAGSNVWGRRVVEDKLNAARLPFRISTVQYLKRKEEQAARASRRPSTARAQTPAQLCTPVAEPIAAPGRLTTAAQRPLRCSSTQILHEHGRWEAERHDRRRTRSLARKGSSQG